MNEIKLEIGKTYKNREGRLVKITKGMEPMINEKGELYRDGWNGIYWGDSIDKKRPKIDNERYEFNSNHWDYTSQFSFFGYKELNTPSKDLVEEVQM